MRIIKRITKSPVEILSGLVLILIGVYVSSVGAEGTGDQGTGLLMAGGALTTFGGVLLSWIAARIFADEQARAAEKKARTDFGDQLANLSRNLGHAAGQINRAVEQAFKNDISTETGLSLIAQANRMIYGQVSEIAVIQGEEFDAAYLLATASKLDEIAIKLEGSGRGKEEQNADLLAELQAVRHTLSRSRATRTYSGATAVCPYCAHANQVELGDVPGDTAAHTCDKCFDRFNAHRRADGTAMTRPIAAPASTIGNTQAPPSKWVFGCPSCGSRLSSKADGRTRKMACLSCAANLSVNAFDQRVEALGTLERVRCSVAGKSGSRPVLACPSCDEPKNALLIHGDDFVAFCFDHSKLLEVSRSDWDLWLTDHD